MKRRDFLRHAAAAVATVAIGLRVQGSLPIGIIGPVEPIICSPTFMSEVGDHMTDAMRYMMAGNRLGKSYYEQWALKYWYDRSEPNAGLRVSEISFDEMYEA